MYVIGEYHFVKYCMYKKIASLTILRKAFLKMASKFTANSRSRKARMLGVTVSDLSLRLVSQIHSVSETLQ